MDVRCRRAHYIRPNVRPSLLFPRLSTCLSAMSSAAFRSIWSVNRKVKENILTKGLLGHGGSGADVPACATLVRNRSLRSER